MKKIILDVDGVLLDTPSIRIKLAREIFGMEVKRSDANKDAFKKKWPQEKKEIDHLLYRQTETQPYPGVMDFLRQLVAQKRDFILLSERRSLEENLAERMILKQTGIEDAVGSERIFIVDNTDTKIPIITDFLKNEAGWVVDDGRDKLEKFLAAGVTADMMWFDEFRSDEKAPAPIVTVHSHEELAELVMGE